MRILSKIIVGTTCLTIFAGTAYVTAITLAPPPNYTVSNNDRLESYDRLAVGNAYEKKTKSQEFYLGLSRWRRKMLKEEGVLRGRVLEVGSGCGGNLAYFPHAYLTDDDETQKYLKEVFTGDRSESPSGSDAPSSISNYASIILDRIRKQNECDEIVLCDRSANMVESCSQKIQKRLGYTPYHYPSYDLEGIRSHILHRRRTKPIELSASGLRKRRVVHDDGTVQDVLTVPVDADDELRFVESESDTLAPIIQELEPGDKLPLLSKAGENEILDRQSQIASRQRFRLSLENAFEAEEAIVLQKRDSRSQANEGTSLQHVETLRGTKQAKLVNAGASTGSAKLPTIPAQMLDDKGNWAPQPLFSVANYAAEQLPFPDNSFDTVVDMFGLCSYDDPVRALREMSRVCRPGGKLLLVEHGRGSTQRVNNHLDKWAPRHAKNWGCWWNRDIRRMIRLSGLSVEKWDNKHFGTSHYIVAKPYKSMKEWDAFRATTSSA